MTNRDISKHLKGELTMSELKALPNGQFDVQDKDGNSVFGEPFRQRETAESAHRMLAMFDAVDGRIAAINNSLKGEENEPR